jgi:hypothetical protein
LERSLLIISGVALAYTSPTADMIGFAGFGLVLLTQFFKYFRAKPKQSAS